MNMHLHQILHVCLYILHIYLHIVIVSYFFILRCLMAQWHYTYITYSTISYGDFRVHFFVELHILRFAKALYVINPQAFGWQHGHCHHPTAYPKPWLSWKHLVQHRDCSDGCRAVPKKNGAWRFQNLWLKKKLKRCDLQILQVCPQRCLLQNLAGSSTHCRCSSATWSSLPATHNYSSVLLRNVRIPNRPPSHRWDIRPTRGTS